MVTLHFMQLNTGTTQRATTTTVRTNPYMGDGESKSPNASSAVCIILVLAIALGAYIFRGKDR